MLAQALGRGELTRAALIAGIIGCFVAGATGGAIIAQLSGRRHTAVVTASVALLLGSAALLPRWSIALVVLAMGGLNAAMSKVGQTTVGLTYVTGTLVKIGQGIGKLLCGRTDGGDWLRQLSMWTCLFAGALTMASLQPWLAPWATWPHATLALLLALTAAARPEPA